MSSSNCSANSGSSTPASQGLSRAKTYRHEPYALNLNMIAPESNVSTPVSGRRCSVNVQPAAFTNGFASFDVAGTPSATTVPPSPSSQTSLTPLVNTVIAPFTPVAVAFKYGKKCFEAPFPVQVGDGVVVEGDRGIDYGVVEGHANALVPGSDQRPLKILRLATAADEKDHRKCTDEEKNVLENMRALAAQVDCSANIEDIMLQLDGKKITVIITRDTRPFVDFRRLQRAAYDAYHCRVWFSYLDEIAETMSTEVTLPLHRAANRKSSSSSSSQGRRSDVDRKRHSYRHTRRAEVTAAH